MVKSIEGSFCNMKWLWLIPFAFLIACNGNVTTDVSPSAKPAYQVSGRASAGALKIERIELSFDNGFGSTTVKQNDDLAAHAQLRFSGNGIFRAQWLVDERIIENINVILSSGSLLTLKMADSTQLPTFEPGPHQLSLKILQPATALKMPVIEYFVKVE